MNIFQHIFPHDEKSWFEKGVSLFKVKKYLKATDAFVQVIKINPRNDKAWNNKGVCILSQVHYNFGPGIPYIQKIKDLNLYDAYDAIGKSVEINPEQAIYWYNKAFFSIIYGNLSQANQEYNKAIDIQPEFCDAWYNKFVLLVGISKIEALDEAKVCENKLKQKNCWNKYKEFKLQEYARLQIIME